MLGGVSDLHTATIIIFASVACSFILRVLLVFVQQVHNVALRKHANSNIFKILQPKQKKKKFQIKKDIIHISARNIACGHSLEPLHNLCF